ncbi:P-loop NTPase family protein [Crateriforma conspicua]|uniref:AAA+ ATPase domain-containing protein n=1 Tax=Crateriforma conspicua TaxID=2527996 RepID=A0A5C5Y630_9PLAN|nr:ATP-binding protein [Crateriforma conspicua]QDV64776.1 hypothetical protein Mal65_39390 [Crateriforma conspicua]TWT70173.1 hypothetical protein Pan14r_24730 [Crateriforma conspicua]
MTEMSPVFPSDNPFRVRRVKPGAIPYQFVDPEIQQDDLVRRIITPDTGPKLTGPKLIVGPHGSGKTTLLHQLVPRIRQHWGTEIWVTLSSDLSPGENQNLLRRSMGTANHHRHRDPWLVIDGIEQLGRLNGWLLTRFLRRSGTRCLATSHRRILGWDHCFATRLNSELIQRLCDQLLADADPSLRQKVFKNLSSRDLHTTTDLRALWFELYDLVADFEAQDRTTAVR